MSLCLIAAWLPTAALASGGSTVTLTAGETTLTVGHTPSDITLTAEGASFITDLTRQITISPDYGLSVKSATGSDTTATVTLSGIPTQSGQVTISAETTAFSSEVSSVQGATISIGALTGGSATASLAGTLTAGVDVVSATITVELQGDGYAFKSDVNNQSYFSLSVNGQGASGLTFTAAQESDAKAILTLGGKPSVSGPLTVTVNTDAFQYTPSAAIADISAGSVGAPTITVDASGDPMTAGKEGTIKLTATSGLFKSGASQSDFTVKGSAEGLTVTQVDAPGTSEATLHLTPTKAGNITSVEI